MSDRGYTVKTIELRAGDSHFELPDTFQFVGFTPTEPLRAVFIERELTETEQEAFDVSKAAQEILAPGQLIEAKIQLATMQAALEAQEAEAADEGTADEVVEAAFVEVEKVEVESVTDPDEVVVEDVSLDEALAILEDVEVSDDTA